MRFSIGNTLLCLTCVCLATAWYVDHFKQEPIVGSWRLYADPRTPPILKFTSEISEICLLSDGKMKITQAALSSGGSEFLGTWTENQDGFIHCHIVSAKDLEESNLRRPADFSFRFAPSWLDRSGNWLRPIRMKTNQRTQKTALASDLPILPPVVLALRPP